MLRRVMGLVAAISFLAGCTNDSPASEPQRPELGTVESQSFAKIPEVVRRLEPSVVTVFTGQGSGSGVVYNTDGIIVTNAHVVGQATQTQVRTVEEFFGALRGVEPGDHVVLQIRRGDDTVKVDLTAGRLPR